MNISETMKRGSGRPKEGYYSSYGRVPGTTTISKESTDGLCQWAANQTVQFIEATGQRVPLDAARAWKDARGEAGRIGNLIHDGIEAVLDGEESGFLANVVAVEDAEVQKGIRRGLKAFSSWYRQSSIEVVDREFPLVSEMYQFGGTPDALGILGEEPRLLDWKGGALRADYLLQLGAYRHLVLECKGVLCETADVVRVNRDTGSFTHLELDREALDLGWRLFLHRLELYQGMKKARKYV